MISFTYEFFSQLRRGKALIISSLGLSRTRRRSVYELCCEEQRIYRKTSALALLNLSGALRTHRMRIRNILEYLKLSGIGVLSGGRYPHSRQFSKDIRQPETEPMENPLKNVREAASYLITSPRVRQLQGRILKVVWRDLFELELNDRQSAVLGSYSNAAWLSRGLLKASGLSLKGNISEENKKRLTVVVEPYTRTMDIRRSHLEGLSRPGRALLSAWTQKRRLGKLRRSGFVPEDLSVLYPDIIDSVTLTHRRQAVVSLKKKYIMKIRVQDDVRRLENYLHLQTLTMGAAERRSI